MREKLNTKILISKGMITNYETSVLKIETNPETKKLMTDTIEEIKDEMVMSCFALERGVDMDVLLNHCNNLDCLFKKLRDLI